MTRAGRGESDDSEAAEAVGDLDVMESLLKRASGRAASWAIWDARTTLDLSQSDFAALLSTELKRTVAQTTLMGWESGDRQPPADAIIAAARLVGKTVEEALMKLDAAPLKRRVELLSRARRRLPKDSETVRRIDRQIASLRERIDSLR